MRFLVISMLASTAILSQPALADDAVADAADAAATAASEADIVVFGQGETRQVQEIQARDIAILTPGTNALKVIEKLPSVNFQSADPFGNYEWSQRISIRSFRQEQLGFTFDGIPLGDMSYGNHNGLHIGRAVSSENIGSVSVSQGAGSLGTQSTGNLGGTVETFSMDPADHRDILGSFTYGSGDTQRIFARIGMGSVDGIRGYVSYAYGSTDKWKGRGVQDQHMVNAKVVIPVGEGKIDGWLSFSDRREQDYQDMSLDMIDRLGWKWDNTFPDYARAVQYADIFQSGGTTYPGNVTQVWDAYYDAAGLRQDWLGSVGYSTPLGERANLKLKGYYHNNKGMGLWATPTVPSPAGPNSSPISIRTTEYDMDRIGAFGSVDFTVGVQNIEVGAWYENNKFHQARRFYAFESRTNPGVSFRDYPSNPFQTDWEFDFTTTTFQYHVRDKIELGDLTVNVGWKGFSVTNKAEAIVQGGYPEGKIKARDWFQPHAGFAYKFSPEAEVFGGFTQVTKAFVSATTVGPFSTSEQGLADIRDDLKPETSDTFELGLRYHSPIFNGTIGAYMVNFRNRLNGLTNGNPVEGFYNTLQNVGSVRAIGFEAAGDLRLGSGFGLYASYSYTDATYRDDVLNPDGTVNAAIKGKEVIDTPKHMLRGEVSYDQGPLFGRVGANYMSKRYYTFINDQPIKGRVVVDASLGFRFTDRIELQVNATNLFDKRYIGTIGSGTIANSDPTGEAQTLLIGAPRQFFATIKAGF